MMRVKPMLDMSVTALVVLAASLVIWRQFVPPGQSQGRPQVENVEGMIPAELTTIARGTGQVALVEFGDFECPFCGKHARETDPQIRKAFVDTGIVRHVFFNYPLANHVHAAPASEAALCAGKQGKFWQMHDALFQKQAALAHADLADRAREIGLEMERFGECVSGGKERPFMERQQSVARELNVRSTPVFFLGFVQGDGSVVLKKRINGALPFSDFRSAIVDVTPAELRQRVGAVALNSTVPWFPVRAGVSRFF